MSEQATYSWTQTARLKSKPENTLPLNSSPLAITSLTDAKLKLGQLYDRVIENLQNCTLEVKRLALDALDIKVYASTEQVEIHGVIPLELPTTARTSA